jgi:two-component system, chemotaxis family, sensor kinase CheA
VTKPFERLAEQARALASRLGKGELNVVIEGGGVRLDPDSWSPFFANLIHAVRNAIDHGIEEPEVREKLGKPRYGTVLFKAIKGANSFTLEIGDDGRGIDWEALAIRAKSKGLPASTHQQLVDALMTDGVSTKSEVSDVSGRGVGMGALMQRIVDMEGTIDVRSTRNKGTTWLIRFPWNPTAIPTVRMRRSVAPPKRLSSNPNKT